MQSTTVIQELGEKLRKYTPDIISFIKISKLWYEYLHNENKVWQILQKLWWILSWIYMIFDTDIHWRVKITSYLVAFTIFLVNVIWATKFATTESISDNHSHLTMPETIFFFSFWISWHTQSIVEVLKNFIIFYERWNIIMNFPLIKFNQSLCLWTWWKNWKKLISAFKEVMLYRKISFSNHPL